MLFDDIFVERFHADPRIRGVDAVDSLACRIQFTAPLDPRRPLDAAQVRLYALPDTTPVAVRALFTTAQYDSLQAKARASADSVRRAKDTTARRDTVRAGAARPPSTTRSRCAWPACPTRSSTSARTATGRAPESRSSPAPGRANRRRRADPLPAATRRSSHRCYLNWNSAVWLVPSTKLSTSRRQPFQFLSVFQT